MKLVGINVFLNRDKVTHASVISKTTAIKPNTHKDRVVHRLKVAIMNIVRSRGVCASESIAAQRKNRILAYGICYRTVVFDLHRRINTGLSSSVVLYYL